MKRMQLFLGAVALGLLLTLLAGLAMAQGPTTQDEPTTNGVSGEASTTATSGAIPIQGRLTDSNGNPLADGNYSVTFRLYESISSGSAICSDTDSVSVKDGLFNAYINFCENDIYGQQLYLGIEVGSDGEMTPRQSIYPVPYAITLRPGAVISDTTDVVLKVQSTGSGDSDAFIADARGTGEAIEAYATDGVGIFAKSDTFIGLQAYSYDHTDNPAIFGCSGASSSVCNPYRDDNASGVMGYSTDGYGGYFKSASTGLGGLYAESNGMLRPAVEAKNIGGGNTILAEADSTGSGNATLYLVQKDSSGDFVVGASVYLGTRYWRVDRTGKGYFNGGTQSSGADFAEQIATKGTEETYEPGDVLVISADADRMVEKSATAFDTAVIGVYSTNPAVLAGAPDTDEPLGGVPVAITGIVPCKVSAENGAIHRGDLLVTASVPGHAMKAGDNPAQGTVLGKALGELSTGTGVIQILVTLQ